MKTASRRYVILSAFVVGGVAFALIGVASFPVGILRGVAERRLSEHFQAPVVLGGLSRRGAFSFTPEIIVRDLRIGQPAWAGKGAFLKISQASAHIPIFSLLTGDVAPQSLHVKGVELTLVRDAKGNSNWAPNTEDSPGGDHSPPRLRQLTIENGRFSLRDAKRRLELTGIFAADPRTGLSISASGRFNGAPARLSASGGRLADTGGQPDWPFSARLASDILDLDARGTMAGALNVRDMHMSLQARGNSLKQLDHVIEAGLFGTQPINLSANVRHKDRDWFVDALEGTIGRSRLRADASILKRQARTRIDARIQADQLDFDDLADDAGLAEARAKEARIGKRVIPDTRINLSKMGPTDGVIRFSIDRLLVKGGSVFRSLKGDLRLDHHVLKLDNAVAGLESGQLKGWVKVDSTRAVPVLSTELRIDGTTLGTLVGQPDKIQGPLRGLVRITGHGDTIRQAFANGNGKIAFVARQGAMNRAAAFVLGQDLGGAIGQSLRDGEAMVPLRCAILAFEARDGVLRPAPLLVETDVSRGSGRGQINLDGETLLLAINGASTDKPALALVDPVRVKGTLSDPAITFNPARLEDGDDKGMLRTVGRSIGAALGLRKKAAETKSISTSPPMNCSRLSSIALR